MNHPRVDKHKIGIRWQPEVIDSLGKGAEHTYVVLTNKADRAIILGNSFPSHDMAEEATNRTPEEVLPAIESIPDRLKIGCVIKAGKRTVDSIHSFEFETESLRLSTNMRKPLLIALPVDDQNTILLLCNLTESPFQMEATLQKPKIP